jgi:stalled ribosome alternative rescue factor ArfA
MNDTKEGNYIITLRNEELFHILHEKHEKGKSSWNDNWTSCECSYCKGDAKLHYGLNIPKKRSKTSWWVIKYAKGSYIRWTNSWLDLLNKKL